MSRDPRDRCKPALDAMDRAIALVRADGHPALAVALNRIRDNFGATVIAHDRAEQSKAWDAVSVVRDQDANVRRKGERPKLRAVSGGKS